MSEQRHKVGDVLSNGVVITEELLEAMAKFESQGVDPEDEARINALLRQGAEENARILKDSRACRCYTEGGVRLTGAHCPMHTVYR
ncbi:MAG: hypothetical protein A2563_01190 [Candidatus Magasanikbacteria bacterium RIFOXYD1_FULL_40_23]|uniref:Uncharacterized protein n=1 Tax=Candidatus Magasanikbacteria bacterium RIFOXYD1_FULL_40_23 TaxID=1798705 RepID=A0A1F6PB63_9BACT|nr:MAG: hypothetical protein A2563_01190 [Candidatus Magasanikbacteria bacterium RIFOXYD1_FULL_40_23]